MRNKQNKHLGMEIPPDLHYKLHYISKYYGRSANGEILYLIRQAIKSFEKNEGEIEFPPKNEAQWNPKGEIFFVLFSYCLHLRAIFDTETEQRGRHSNVPSHSFIFVPTSLPCREAQKQRENEARSAYAAWRMPLCHAVPLPWRIRRR